MSPYSYTIDSTIPKNLLREFYAEAGWDQDLSDKLKSCDLVLVAHDKEPLGFIAGKTYDRTLCLHGFYVAEEERRKNIGKSLLYRVFLHAKREGLGQVYSTNVLWPARRLYGKLMKKFSKNPWLKLNHSLWYDGLGYERLTVTANINVVKRELDRIVIR